MLRDLGSHVVDQMVWLLGPVVSVTAHLDWVDLPAGRTDAGFSVAMRHSGGVWSQVEASKLNCVSVRELRAYGSQGSYRYSGEDVQAQAIFAGIRPVDDPCSWGYGVRRGILSTQAGEEPVASQQGRYHDFYTQLALAARGEAEQPVPAWEGVRTLAVLDAARVSAQSGRTERVQQVAGSRRLPTLPNIAGPS